jgi:hypothetical protein
MHIGRVHSDSEPELGLRCGRYAGTAGPDECDVLEQNTDIRKLFSQQLEIEVSGRLVTPDVVMPIKSQPVSDCKDLGMLINNEGKFI